MESTISAALQAGSHSLPHPVKALSSLPSSYGHAVKAVCSPAGCYVDFQMPLDGEAVWWYCVEGQQVSAEWLGCCGLLVAAQASC